MEIDIVGPQCHLIAARNINHIFNCKLLTFPHYCFVFLCVRVSLCVLVCLFEGLIPKEGEKVTRHCLRAENDSVLSILVCSLFDVDCCKYLQHDRKQSGQYTVSMHIDICCDLFSIKLHMLGVLDICIFQMLELLLEPFIIIAQWYIVTGMI